MNIIVLIVLFNLYIVILLYFPLGYVSHWMFGDLKFNLLKLALDTYANLPVYLFKTFGWYYIFINFLLHVPLLFYITYARKNFIPLRKVTIFLLYIYKIYFMINVLAYIFHGFIGYDFKVIDDI